MGANSLITLDQIQQIFPIPCEFVRTRGTGNGLIIKCKTFYLKIYDKPSKDSYEVQQYVYGIDKPVFAGDVKYSIMREYLAGFTTDDYNNHIPGYDLNHHITDLPDDFRDYVASHLDPQISANRMVEG